ncbi:phosphatidate cytidylyltransferase [Luteibacter yeojuensis]|uniref:Phosphatidate cytidylyltransferase n=1 Tax=Luteibacter yeojuensis TaxID=345309 RepID=A0A7X5QU37_9GAMM|nr:phosphatidate cytidylyltransferase [Luteibacter yeojuensis]NID15456.1 phosphatidate cytidylyltransferase [Luteibacter yeojuensis]
MNRLLVVTALILSVLLIASLIGWRLDRRTPEGARSTMVANLNQRIRAWWVMALILGICLWAGKSVTLAFFAILSALSLKEFMALSPPSRADRWPLALSFCVLITLQYGLIGIGWYGLFSILIPLYGFLLLPAISALRGETDRFLDRCAKVQFGLLLSAYCISHVPALWLIRIPGHDDQTILLIIYLLLVAQMSDVFQFVFGRIVGKHPLAPRVSPSKTIEGLVGGGLSAVVIGGLMWWITPFSPMASLAMSVLIVLCGFLGGLTLSAIKRSHGVKDWGSLIGGHGGVLDRLDSVYFSAPVFFHTVRFFYE